MPSRRQRSEWAVEGAVQGVVGVDPGGTIVRWNSGARRILGYRPSEALGQSLTELFPPLARELRTLLRIARPRHPAYAEAAVRRSDGRTAEVAFTVVRIADPDRVLLIVRDVSARNAAERRLRETVSTLEGAQGEVDAARRAIRAHARLERNGRRDLFFIVESALVLFDSMSYLDALSNLCRFVVPRAADRCEVLLQEPDGSVFRTSGGPLEPASLPTADPVQRVLSTGDYELWGGAEGGAPGPAPSPAAMLVLPLRTRSGVAGTITFARSESKRRIETSDIAVFQAVARLAGMAIESGRLYAEALRLNEELEVRVEQRTAELREALRDLDAYASAAAHDLRTPLRSLNAFSEMLLEECGDRLDERGREYAGRIRAACARLDALVLDLLAYSRVSRRDAELGPVGLQGVVDGVLRGMEDEIRQAHADVRVEAPLGAVRGNRVVLEQVLRNLLSNALRYVAPGTAPRIRVAGERRGPRVRLWVEDNGVGIPPEDQERIFRPFERGAPPGAPPGTGLGLSIVRRGAERMGGEAGLESAPGQGSRFWIDLPAADPPSDR